VARLWRSTCAGARLFGVQPWPLRTKHSSTWTESQGWPLRWGHYGGLGRWWRSAELHWRWILKRHVTLRGGTQGLWPIIQGSGQGARRLDVLGWWWHSHALKMNASVESLTSSEKRGRIGRVHTSSLRFLTRVALRNSCKSTRLSQAELFRYLVFHTRSSEQSFLRFGSGELRAHGATMDNLAFFTLKCISVGFCHSDAHCWVEAHHRLSCTPLCYLRLPRGAKEWSCKERWSWSTLVIKNPAHRHLSLITIIFKKKMLVPGSSSSPPPTPCRPGQRDGRSLQRGGDEGPPNAT